MLRPIPLIQGSAGLEVQVTERAQLSSNDPRLQEPFAGLQHQIFSFLLHQVQRQLHFHFSLSCIREGNGSPLQCSCLENPRDGGAWWAAVYGIAQSWTRLKRLSSCTSSRYKGGDNSLKFLASASIYLCCLLPSTLPRPLQGFDLLTSFQSLFVRVLLYYARS